MKTVKAWHFVSQNRTLTHNPHIKVEPGYTYYDNDPDFKPILCKQGFHGNIDILDTLYYAPGPICCRVEIGGIVLHNNDKLVGSERTVLWMVDAEQVLREFARKCALDVVHLWDAPQVVVDYLSTGNEEGLRDTAWAANSAAARDATLAAARAARAARVAASVTRGAASVAWAAARAARDATRDAAWAAAWAAARGAAWAATLAATSAASAAASAASATLAATRAARDAARAAQSKRLVKMMQSARR